MKTYVIILSEKFPITHSKKVQDTEFGSSLLNGQKIHTIRANYPLWEKRIKEVQSGKAVLSLREWAGKPYRSKQVELAQLTNIEVGSVQRLELAGDNLRLAYVDGYCVDKNILAENDGLSFDDWDEWFKACAISKPLAIIHFTKFSY